MTLASCYAAFKVLLYLKQLFEQTKALFLDWGGGLWFEILPDLGQLPAIQNSAHFATLSALTQVHNRGLRRSLKVLPHWWLV